MGKIDSQIVAATEKPNTAAQIEYWKQGLGVSLHFNDMCIRLRVLSLTVLATFFAGAAVSMAQYPSGEVVLFGQHVHVSAALCGIALMFVTLLWLLDQRYYYPMLIASVENSEEVEPHIKAVVYDLVRGKTLTEKLTGAIPRTASSTIANIYYGAQVLMCCVMLISAAFYGPTAASTNAPAAPQITLGPGTADAHVAIPPPPQPSDDTIRGRDDYR